jgi:hypothetical protein
MCDAGIPGKAHKKTHQKNILVLSNTEISFEAE